MGSVEVNIENKNILPNNYTTQTKNGVTLTNNGDGTITLNGTATAKTYFFPSQSGYISLDLDGDYTFSANTYNNLRYSLYHSINTLIFWETQENLTFNQTGSFDDVRVQISVLEGSTYNNTVVKLQIEKGTNATSWVEHKTQSYIMPVQQEMLEGDYIEDVEHHEWGKLVLTGSEVSTRWPVTNNIGYRFIIPAENLLLSAYLTEIPQILCNKLSAKSLVNTYNRVEGIAVNNTTSVLIIYIEECKDMTVEEFKAWLKEKYDSGNPVVVYYKLAEPVNLELTSEQKAVREKQLCTYKNITNISLSDELASIDVTYKKDLEAEHDKLQEKNDNLQSQIDEIKQLLSTTETSALLLDNLQKDIEMEVE